ncbi:MAG TPA: SAM-dependent methyltransferase [Streptosporangiaceae bacterium]|nr:SAM-dependent methyltransferase [Streptosporangiaceae bacterium]
MTENEAWRNKFRPDIPSTARIYDYLLGGKDNYPADRAAAAEIVQALPNVRTAFQWNRAFLGRAVRYLVAQQGVRQFIDIGTGLPTVGNVHEVAQKADPDARVAYVDNDPVVLAHGRHLLHGVGGTTILEHDLRRPEDILADPDLRALIDFEEPVAVLLVAILHFIPDSDNPAAVIRKLMEPFPRGSYLVVSHGTADAVPGVNDAAAVYRQSTSSAHVRSREHIQRLISGLDLVKPGIVWLPEWRPDPGTELPANPADAYFYALVARKP